jgi:hypothetical protein
MERVKGLKRLVPKGCIILLTKEYDWPEEGGNGRSKLRMVTIPVL